ncbi:MAG: diguanylate cyclase [Desulfobacteraceae bacterium]|nr:diguanylate cyclase [Desulfobacteraceae bacterium]
MNTIKKKIIDLPLNLKVILMLLIVWASYEGINYMVHRHVIMPSFIFLEHEERKKDVHRIIQTIDREILHIDQICHDWSAWDTLYQFAQSKCPNFIEENLGESTFGDAGLNLAMIVGLDGRVLGGKILDFKTRKDIVLKEFPNDRFPLNHLLLWTGMETGRQLPDMRRSGIIKTSAGLLLVSSRPILTTDNQGPIMGSMIMGKILTQSAIGEISGRIKLDFRIILRDSKDFTPSLGAKTDSLTEASPYHIEKKGDKMEVIAWYDIMDDNKGVVIKLTSPAKIIERGLVTIKMARYSTTASLVVFFLVVLLLLSTTVLNPIIHLKNHIKRIIQTGDLSSRIHIDRRDEIGSLAHSFDTMIEHLDEKTEELERMATIDSLSGLYSRIAFMKTLECETKKCKRYKSTYGIIMFDIDKFKLVNDTFGHVIGDQVITRVGKVIKEELRDSDMAGRYGGEEFIAYLPNQDEEKSYLVAERIRKKIESLTWKQKGLHVTISGGISAFFCDDVKEIIKAADKRLYQAKHGGRNQIIMA